MLLVAGPLLGLWLVSPLVAWWLSRTLPAPPSACPMRSGFSGQAVPANLALLRGLCHGGRKLASAGQLSGETGRRRRLAHQPDQHRHGAAGGPGRLRLRLLQRRPAARSHQKTFATLARMERHRGHFYNWYDTRSLKPLLPLYVSTVDSGNLVGHLLVLRSGLLELIEAKVLPAAHLRGLARHGARSAGRGPWTSPDGAGRPHAAGCRRRAAQDRAPGKGSGESTRTR